MVLLAGCIQPMSGPETGSEDATEAILAVLEHQVAAWNGGDQESFMEGYMKSDSLRFASGATVQYGWQTTLDRYRTAYPDRAAMGRLTFSELDIRVLSPEYALVFGRWRLKRERDMPGGLFTLLFRKVDGQWVIVHDHTSS
jgi:ketosteroid isomerase-like protein